MKINRSEQTVITIALSLNEQERAALSELVQNPHFDNEDVITKNIRKEIFNALNPVRGVPD